MDKKLNILICPLEWGLGHASRMIPVALKLRSMNQNVIIGSGEKHLALYKIEIPGIPLIYFPGFRPYYSGHLPQYLVVIFQLPLLFYHVIKEHRMLKNIITENKIDIVISDNRFGLWTKKAKTAYVTHQPRIPFPRPLSFLEFIGIRLHRFIIKKFDFCFIPDLPGDTNVTGRLTHGVRLVPNARFIGLLSRFTDIVPDKDNNPVKKPHHTVILSGPEAQKIVLKKKLTDIFKESEIPAVFLGGNPGSSELPGKAGNIIFYEHLPSSIMKEVLVTSEKIISRSGYSTIMELISLNQSALLIPTPGQTEQEYLAESLDERGWFTVAHQKDIDRQLPPVSSKVSWPGQIMQESRLLLENALTELLKY